MIIGVTCGNEQGMYVQNVLVTVHYETSLKIGFRREVQSKLVANIGRTELNYSFM